MKIKLLHDAGFVYDLLSIYQIKCEKNKNDKKALDNFNSLNNEIRSQVGDKKHDEIISSNEYKNLIKTNSDIYLRIDELKTRGEIVGDAVFIDLKNHQRWVEKNNLQNKWFDTVLVEQKFGYNK